MPPKAAQTRASRISQVAGKSITGTPLDANNKEPWTNKQKYVFDKAMKKGVLPDTVQKAWAEAQGKGDKQRQREIVNSTVDPSAGYNFEISLDLGDPLCKGWLRSVEGITETKRSEKEVGVSLSAIELKYGDHLQRAKSIMRIV